MERHSTDNRRWRFLFSSSAGYGHLHPLMPLALALKEAGHEIAFAMPPSRQQLIEANGFTFFPVITNMANDPEYQQLKAQLKTMPLNLEYELFAYPRLFGGIATRLRMPKLVEIAQDWQPDMFIREAGEYGAVIAAEYLSLPHAVVAFAAALKGQAVFEREIAEQLAPIRQQWGLPPDPAATSLYRYLQLSYSPPGFSLGDVGYPGSGGSIPATTHFIRPQFFDQADSESLPDWIWELPKQPLVYLTLGTEVNSESDLYPRVLQTIIAGLRDAPLNLIVTIGRDKDPADFGQQPSNVHIERYIPQSLLLPHCDLIVQHGGSNSLLAAIDTGLPMVIIPLIADQFFNASIVQKLQVGQVLQLQELTPASIRGAVEEVLINPLYRQNIVKLRNEIQALPNQQYAVQLVEKVVAEHHTKRP